MNQYKNITFPAEWAPQDFVQLTWPHIDTDWQYMLDEVNACFAEIAHFIVQFERLLIVTPEASAVKELLGDIDFSRITFAEMPTNDTWARDHGGITITADGLPRVLDFTFNGWGLKFGAHYDNQITRKLHQQSIFPSTWQYENRLKIVLEGGSVESDGKGTLLTTAECLLSDNRNHYTREEAEEMLRRELGAKKILWLHHGYLAGDDTDCHIDTLARLCPDDTICYVKCSDEKDEHFTELQKMEEELKAFRTADGQPYRLIALPMAEAVYDDAQRLPATYANYLIINGAVLVPTYNSSLDELALKQIQKAFPDRRIIGINCLSLIQQHGSLHCVTMQYPTL